MDGVKSLLGSKTFWVQFLGLVALITGQFHLTAAQAWAMNPDTLQLMLTISGIVFSILGMYFRSTATKQITSILPSNLPPVMGSGVIKSLPLFLLVPFLAFLGSCSSTSNPVATVINDINQINAALTSPAGLQAISTLKAQYVGVVCGVAVGSTFVNTIAVDTKATATVNGTLVVMAISADLCKSANGVVGP